MFADLHARIATVVGDARASLAGYGRLDTAEAWATFRHLHAPPWMRVGAFAGHPVDLLIRGERDYVYRKPTPPAVPLGFTRANGEQIVPGSMVTDGGSIPHIFWSIPGLNPWDYMDAFLIHDWMFLAHHCKPELGFTFEQTNDTLAEAIYTLMQTGAVRKSLADVVVIHAAVSGPGRAVWDKSWTPEMCAACVF